jgi:hypothetical protein
MWRAILVACSMSEAAPEDQLLGDPAAHRHRDVGVQLLARHRDAVAFGQPHHHAERPAARNDGGLVDRI